ncbi:transducin beta-like protein 3 [Cylas formicarius]|uniref:transducin beta-like protein 3 n=1 Tax=Cylas formicarius TaxID=197179 RepID=UPI0029584F98|nr:transducin beta-like protein 3 [Cylas formicarius]
MANAVKLKEVYEIQSKHGAFYTGGNVEWLESTFYCQSHASVNLLDAETGAVERLVGDADTEDADAIHTFTTDGVKIVSAHKSGLLKLWKISGELEKTWKCIHKGSVAKLALNGDHLASGGSDSSIRLWNWQLQTCLLNLKGCTGVVNVVTFHDNVIFASGDDGNINSYELERGDLVTAYKGHYNKVTSLAFAHEGQRFVSSGRDKVLILWELGRGTPLKTVATYETIETLLGMPRKFKLPGFQSDPDSVYVASAGEKGVVRVWDVPKGREVFVQPESTAPGVAVTHLRHDPKTKGVAVVTVDHNIVVHHLKSFVCLKQFVGFTGEIHDVVYVGHGDTHIAIATNSNDIKVFDNAYMSCRLLKGHTDLVLALAVSDRDRDLMLSSAKDNAVRLWRFGGGDATCVAIGALHTGSVGAIAFARGDPYAVSAGHDNCLKMWRVDEGGGADVLRCTRSQVAHQKEINSVAVSPNDKIIATASQDRTVKLWTDALDLLGTLAGHKRGVWCVRFSPADQVVASCSADCTIKLWSVTDLVCLRTMEGHEASVLRLEFLSKGAQILSAGADGLVKLFNVKNASCESTAEGHEGRIWALAVKGDESELVTGGSDSSLVRWTDATEERRQRRRKDEEELTLIDQRLSNYLQADELLKALELSLTLNRPQQTLRIVERAIKKKDVGLAEAVRHFDEGLKTSLLKCALDWNTNGRNCQAAQLVLNILLQELQTGKFRPVGLASLVEGALPYTERHFKRLTRTLQDMHLLNYTVNCMKPNSKYTRST